MPSFLSEHTAEFILVPQAAEVFSAHADAVIPIYFWTSREGSSTAINCELDTHLQVVSIFARRPKIFGRSDTSIVVKFNAELFEYAAAALAHGIPTLAGIPLVSSLAQLRQNCKCAWFRLIAGPPADIELELSIDGRCLSAEYPSHITGPMSLKSLAPQAIEEARELEWESALNVLRELRSKIGSNRYARFMGGYKPFNMLLLH